MFEALFGFLFYFCGGKSKFNVVPFCVLNYLYEHNNPWHWGYSGDGLSYVL